MGIERVQERGPGDAIGSATLKSGGIIRAGIATDNVVSCAAWIIRIVDSKLSVIENVKSLSTKLKLAGFADFEMLQQSHVEVHAAWIIQEVAASVAEGEPAGSHKWRWIANERAKALRVIARRSSPFTTSG